MFRTTAEAEGKGLDLIKLVQAPQPSITDRSKAILLLRFLNVIWARGYKTFLMLSSIEHKF